jgi:hypothetical protein
MARRTCECGECAKCKHREYMNAWYRRPERAQRVRTWAKRYRDTNAEAVREYDRKRQRERDRTKVLAQKAVDRAIRRGDIAPQPCEVCGVEDLRGSDGRRLIQAHHEDYTRQLDVRWLCVSCHGAEHRVIA